MDRPAEPGPSGVLTVSQVNSRVKRLLNADSLLADLTVRGEISNWKAHSSGHCYFSLKDDRAELRCAMFRSAAARLRFQPANGMLVRAGGRVDVYEQRGDLQFYVESLLHDGAGALFEAFERLKAKLAAEGLFEPGRKRSWPTLPRRVALVTSPTGAAVQDMTRILRQRWPNVRLLLVPAIVQGAEAAPSLVKALAQANRVPDVEVILCGRGGGSMEDLWAFNEEPVARAVAASRVPVISCVGHETDFCICDFVADQRAATPSHAAQLAVPDVAQMLVALDGLDRRLYHLLARRIDVAHQALAGLLSRRVMRRPEVLLEGRMQSIDDLTARLGQAGARRLERAEARLAGLSATLEALDPSRVLGRGYAILVRQNGNKVVQSPADLPPGEAAVARLAHGRLRVVSDGEVL